MRVQLGGNSLLRKNLAAATAILLGSGVSHAAGDYKLDSSLLLYSETDRVQAAEYVLGISHSLPGDRILHGKLTFDALTGPSPNGALPSNRVQTFTRPSGSGSYTVEPGKTPFDDTFHDTRFALDGGYTIPIDHLTSFDFGGHLSGEHDYTSIGASLSLSRDFNRKNTNLALSTAFSHDLVNPEGGAPDALSSMREATGEGEDGEFDGEREGGGSSDSKEVLDVVLGVTQVLDRVTLLRLNYSFNRSSGYLNDPYKIISLVEGRGGTSPGEPVDYLYESRPDSRTKHALYAEARRYLSGHTLRLAYRYFWDNWGIESHTVDFWYRLPLRNGHALQPHVRWYRQSEADFYASYLVDGAPLPEHASADYRLAPFHAITLGLEYQLPLRDEATLRIGGEYYAQTGDISPPSSLGPLSQYELFPKLKAIMVRAGVSYAF